MHHGRDLDQGRPGPDGLFQPEEYQTEDDEYSSQWVIQCRIEFQAQCVRNISGSLAKPAKKN
jgi:hypothetical protein